MHRAVVCAWMAAALALPVHAQPSIQRVPLADLSQAQTEDGRERLQYLIGCALPEGVIVEADVAGAHYEFPGQLGLAPAWRERALTGPESRWVSACILARSNFFHRSVQISLRAKDAPVDGLVADDAERARFHRHEAGFFGNIFEPDAPAYVCIGDDDSGRHDALYAMNRVCSLPAEASDKSGVDFGRALSRCGFLIVGACSAKPFLQDGVDYTAAVVHVYLAPP